MISSCRKLIFAGLLAAKAVEATCDNPSAIAPPADTVLRKSLRPFVWSMWLWFMMMLLMLRASDAQKNILSVKEVKKHPFHQDVTHRHNDDVERIAYELPEPSEKRFI